MNKELREKVLGKLEEVYIASVELEDAYENVDNKIKDLERTFDLHLKSGDSLDKIQHTTKTFKDLTSKELDFNFNGKLDHYNGHQCRIIQYGDKFAFEYSYYYERNYGHDYGTETKTIPFDTKEEAENYFISRLILGRIKIVNGTYLYNY